MRKLVIATMLLGTLGVAGTAIACPGQCYTADGRPIGPTYDPARPDDEWIGSIVARGGNCTGATPESPQPYSGFSAHERPNHRHLEWHQRRQRD